MKEFITLYNRWRCVVFTVLASIVILTGLFLVYGMFSLEALAVALILIGVSALYFFLGRCSHLHQETRYLLRTIPVLFLVALIGGLFLTGFIVYLVNTSQPLQMTSGGTPFEEIPRLIGIIFLVLGLLLPLFVVFAARDVMHALRAHHHVGQQSIRFFTRKKEWTVHARDYYALVLGETIVLACKKRGDVAQAVTYVNRPLQQSWLAQPLDGVYYLNTEKLADNLRTKGFDVREERRAVIIQLS